MTNKEAKEKLYMEWQKFLEDNIDYAGISDAYKTAFKALEQEPCEDAISRQAVCKIIDDIRDCVSVNGYWAFLERLKKLPSVNPTKTGYWIEHKNNGMSYIECSKCSTWFLRMYLTRNSYCPNCGAKMIESEEAQPKQTGDSCLDFDFDKVKETLKKDNLDNLIVDHTCEEKQEQTRDEKMIDAIDFAIKVTDSQDDYSMGMRNGMRYVKSLIDDKEPPYELRWSDEEIKLGINLGDEVVDDYGAKGVVVGIDTYNDEVLLSLLMGNHKVPQLVKASMYKTKTGRHFPQIIEVLEQIKGESDGK